MFNKKKKYEEQQIVAYKATDGTAFEDHDDLINHERRLVLNDYLVKRDFDWTKSKGNNLVEKKTKTPDDVSIDDFLDNYVAIMTRLDEIDGLGEITQFEFRS